MRTRLIAFALGVTFISACQDPARPDLNNPGPSDYSDITSTSQVQALVVGMLGEDRNVISGEILRGEVLGRDAYNLPVSEPRWVTEMLGPSIDPGGFNGTATWPYQPVRLANIAIPGVQAATPDVLTDEQKSATIGFLHTLKALSYLRAIETRDTAGVPIAVDIEPTSDAAPLVCKGDALVSIVALLDSGNAELVAGGTEFPFGLPSGFEGFDNPAGFAEFNRALAAKVNIYLAFRDYAPPGGSPGGPIDVSYLTAAQAALDASFINTAASTIADLNVGPKHTYSTSSGDALNGLFGDPSSTDFRANPRVVSEADAGDDRLRKVVKTDNLTLSGVSSDWAFTIYPTPTTPTNIITNKELILLQAEVDWGMNQMGPALAMANVVRTVDGGLASVSLSDPDDILDQILYEKRYSLLWESPARWVDARMFGKLNGEEPPAGLGMENGNAPLWNMPIPKPEADARGGILTKTCTTS